MTTGFQIAEQNLMRQYSHFLRNAKIIEIFVQEEPFSEDIVYNVIYQTRVANFLAILEYNKKTEEPAVKSLVVAQERDLKPKIDNCKRISSSLKCSECEEGYALDKDGLCYKKVENCEIFTGNVCCVCEKSYELENNQCIDSCGLLCKET